MSGKPYAAIVCDEHGSVDIDEGEYERQLARPDASWRCPTCRQTGWFDEDRFEALHGIGTEAQATA